MTFMDTCAPARTKLHQLDMSKANPSNPRKRYLRPNFALGLLAIATIPGYELATTKINDAIDAVYCIGTTIVMLMVLLMVCDGPRRSAQARRDAAMVRWIRSFDEDNLVDAEFFAMVWLQNAVRRGDDNEIANATACAEVVEIQRTRLRVKREQYS